MREPLHQVHLDKSDAIAIRSLILARGAAQFGPTTVNYNPDTNERFLIANERSIHAYRRWLEGEPIVVEEHIVVRDGDDFKVLE